MDAIDTSILIWGVKRQSPPDRPDIVDRCIALLDMLKSKHSVIMVPSIVVAEYLADFPPDKQEEQRRIFGRHFFVALFDAGAAAIVGQIYSKKNMQEAQSTGNACRQCVKADLNIIATTITHHASRIYTDNTKHFKILACGRIIVEGIPPLPLPTETQQGLGFGQ